MISQKSFLFAIFCLFLLEMSRNFRQTAIFHFWAKAMLLLNPFSAGIFWKTDIKKTLNSYMSKTRTNSESKLKFSESSFIHGRELRPLQPPVPLPATRSYQRVNEINFRRLRRLVFARLTWFKNLFLRT